MNVSGHIFGLSALPAIAVFAIIVVTLYLSSLILVLVLIKCFVRTVT